MRNLSPEAINGIPLSQILGLCCWENLTWSIFRLGRGLISVIEPFLLGAEINLSLITLKTIILPQKHFNNIPSC